MAATPELNESHKKIMEAYARAIVHMRGQFDAKRFGLIFGAGLSQKFGVPTWTELVNNIAKDPKVNGEDILKIVAPRAALSYKTEMLFEHFRQREYAANGTKDYNRHFDVRVGSEWKNIIRKYLYCNITEGVKSVVEKHPYFESLIPIIKNTQMTVTYNFDDFIEQAILSSRESNELDSRCYETVTNTWTQFRRPNGIIYHPNGFIPKNELESPSDHFVFSETSFANKLMGIFAGENAGLINHISKNTCLLIGLSLEDETLRNALMQAAQACPGNYHYYIHYMNGHDNLTDEERNAIKLANFKVYNLITLFLCDDEIKALSELINTNYIKPDRFCDFAEKHNIKTKFIYYLTGPLGVGKSTIVSQFRNLDVLEEWLEERPKILGEHWEKLSPEKREQADSWILEQFRQKNNLLRRKLEGLFLLDRSPLDPIVFSEEENWATKATKMKEYYSSESSNCSVENGRLILLNGDYSELALRMLHSKRKDYTKDELSKMYRSLKKVYTKSNVYELDTSNLNLKDVITLIGKQIHIEEYTDLCNFDDIFNNIAQGGASDK